MQKFIRGLLLGLTLLSGTANAGLEAGKPTVMITGANRGIGLEFVRQYSALDWNVIATARNPKKAKELKAQRDSEAAARSRSEFFQPFRESQSIDRRDTAAQDRSHSVVALGE